MAVLLPSTPRLLRTARWIALGGGLLLGMGRLGWSENFATISLSVTLAPAGSTTTAIALGTFGQSAEPFTSFRSYLVIPITVNLTGPSQISNIQLFYRRHGDVTYTPAQGPNAFSPSFAGTTFYRGTAIVPGAVITDAGVDYYMEVTAADGTTARRGDPANPLFLPFQPVFETDVPPSGAAIDLPDNFIADGNVTVVFPQGAVTGPSQVQMSQLSDAEIDSLAPGNGLAAVARPVAAYKINLTQGVPQKPTVLSFLYPDVDATPNQVDGTTVDEGSLRLFWWDGFTWRLLGGNVNLANNSVTALSTRLGTFALFPSAAFATPKIFRPLEKIITPNSDGINDAALFAGLAPPFEIRIYDLTGRRVRTIADGQVPEWDGRDDDGNVVEIGSYIYQYRSDFFKDWVSGMLAVAK